jgi:excisionase family DNA binding protein
MMDEWLSVPELAERIGLSKEAVYRLARAGELPGAIKLGRRYVVHYGAFLGSAGITPAA